MSSLNLPFGLRVLNGLPVDNKYYNLSDTPYTNTAQVISQIPSGARYPGLTVVVGTGGGAKEYWWKLAGGVTDGELIEKTDSATLAGTGGAALVGISNIAGIGGATTVQSALANIAALVQTNAPQGALMFMDQNPQPGVVLTGWTEETSTYAGRNPIVDSIGIVGGSNTLDISQLPSISFTGSASGTVTVNSHTHAATGLTIPDHNHAVKHYAATGSNGRKIQSTLDASTNESSDNTENTSLTIGGATAGTAPGATFTGGVISGTSTGTIGAFHQHPYFRVRVFRRNAYI